MQRFLVVIAMGVCVAAFAAVPKIILPLAGVAQAQPADAEKQAFEAAKELGTVEAWDAFQAQRDGAREAAPQLCRDNGGEWGEGQCWPKGHYSSTTKKNRTGLSCKELKARCSRTDTDADCKRYLNSCTGHGDN